MNMTDKKCMAHKLKCLRGYFQAVKLERKRFEVRVNDRNFRLGDFLLLQEYDPSTDIYTGDELLCKVTYILDDPAYVKEGYVIMSIDIIDGGIRKPKDILQKIVTRIENLTEPESEWEGHCSCEDEYYSGREEIQEELNDILKFVYDVLIQAGIFLKHKY